jgi:hypothetical protein
MGNKIFSPPLFGRGGRGVRLFLAALLLPLFANAQFTITDGKKSLEISGVVYTFYNHRFYQKGETNKDKNLFRLRDARIKL